MSNKCTVYGSNLLEICKTAKEHKTAFVSLIWTKGSAAQMTVVDDFTKSKHQIDEMVWANLHEAVTDDSVLSVAVYPTHIILSALPEDLDQLHKVVLGAVVRSYDEAPQLNALLRDFGAIIY